MPIQILNEDLYRSQPAVNKDYDMVRVTFTCTRNEWRQIKKLEGAGFTNLLDYLNILREKIDFLRDQNADLNQIIEKAKKKVKNYLKVSS